MNDGMEDQMGFVEWEKTVPESFTNDSLWKMTAYRYALYLGDLAWEDATALMKDHRTASLADDLYSGVGSVSANLAEGYSRGTGKDRAGFYQFSLGAARKSRDRYFKARFVLGSDILEHRSRVLSEIIRLLLTMIPQQRGRSIKEDQAPYEITPDF